ncbi:UNVERIFIED_CONTAM: hypothetical protein GTU68_063089 [Idotea baltica]|nr:hypothetical protein [Idotea baltica]
MSLRNPGILLINLGTPDKPERKDVNRYLLQFLTDERVIDFPWLKRQLLVRGLIVPMRAANSTDLYKQLWTDEGSPLKYYGERLTALVAERLGGQIPVALGMRYQNPSIEVAIEELLGRDVDEIIVFPAQSHATTRALAAKLDLSEDRYTTCFQSRLGKEVWTQPYASQVIEERASKGDKRILVFSPSFVADCLETTVEVGIEYQDEFVAAGGEKLDLVPSLNDDPKWVEAILQIIKERIKLDIN